MPPFQAEGGRLTGLPFWQQPQHRAGQRGDAGGDGEGFRRAAAVPQAGPRRGWRAGSRCRWRRRRRRSWSRAGLRARRRRSSARISPGSAPCARPTGRRRQRQPKALRPGPATGRRRSSTRNAAKQHRSRLHPVAERAGGIGEDHEGQAEQCQHQRRPGRGKARHPAPSGSGSFPKSGRARTGSRHRSAAGPGCRAIASRPTRPAPRRGHAGRVPGALSRQTGRTGRRGWPRSRTRCGCRSANNSISPIAASGASIPPTVSSACLRP